MNNMRILKTRCSAEKARTAVRKNKGQKLIAKDLR